MEGSGGRDSRGTLFTRAHARRHTHECMRAHSLSRARAHTHTRARARAHLRLRARSRRSSTLRQPVTSSAVRLRASAFPLQFTACEFRRQTRIYTRHVQRRQAASERARVGLGAGERRRAASDACKQRCLQTDLSVCAPSDRKHRRRPTASERAREGRARRRASRRARAGARNWRDGARTDRHRRIEGERGSG